jgi:NitT/TauT family transport system permease protein
MTSSSEILAAAPGWRDRAASFALPAASLSFAVLVLVTWQYLPPALGVPKYIIPRVSDLVSEMGRMWRSENLLGHFVSTATLSVIGFVLGSMFGAVCGYALGLSPLWEKVLSPFRSRRRSRSRPCSSCGSATTPGRS